MPHSREDLPPPVAPDSSAPPASASERTSPVAVSGRVYGDIYAPLYRPENAGQNYALEQGSASAWLQGDLKLGAAFFSRLVLQGDGIATSIFPAQKGFHFDAREGYAGFSENGFELRAGRQIIPWGKSDVINPTDFLTAQDFAIFNPDPEVTRRGGVSVLAAWTPRQGDSPVTVTGVWTILPPHGRLAIPPGLVPAGVNVDAEPVHQDVTFANSEGALKLAYAGAGYDFSLSAFRGWRHQPILVAGTPDLATGTAEVAQAYQPSDALGADFSASTGSWVFRAETSYTRVDTSPGDALQGEPSHYDAVAGLERPLGEDFRIQSQFVWRYIPEWRPAAGATPLAAGVAQVNALLLGYQDQSHPGATLRIAYTREASRLEAEIFGYGSFNRGDALLRPKVSWGVTDALRFTVGLDYYTGPDDSPLGALHTLTAGFFETKYVF